MDLQRALSSLHSISTSNLNLSLPPLPSCSVLSTRKMYVKVHKFLYIQEHKSPRQGSEETTPDIPIRLSRLKLNIFTCSLFAFPDFAVSPSCVLLCSERAGLRRLASQHPSSSQITIISVFCMLLILISKGYLFSEDYLLSIIYLPPPC